MSDNKKYYWLKLKENFFTQKEIKRLRRLAGGDTYTIIYLKLLLLSLKNEGKIFFDDVGDNFIDELSLEIDEEADNIKMTLSYLQQKGLLELINQDEIYLNEVKTMLGSESESVERVRKHRREIKLVQEEVKAIGNIPYIENYQNNKLYDGNYYKALQRDSMQCKSCGSTENLNMHHIIGNRQEFKSSRDKSSLITLCRKCHSKEHANPHSIVTDKLLESIEFDFKLYKLIDEISNNTGTKKLETSVTSNRNNVTSNNDVTKSNTEIEKDIELEKDIDIENKKSKKAKKVYSENDLLNQTILDFIEMRKGIKKPLSEAGIKLMLSKLKKLSTDENIQIEILNQSIFNSWQGIFELKENKEGGKFGTIQHKEISTPRPSEETLRLEKIIKERGYKADDIKCDF